MNEDLLARFDKLDAKFDDLRRELMASFVLKQVFDVALEARDKAFDELKRDFEEHKANQMGSLQRGVAIVGGLLGIISTALYLLHLIGLSK